MLRRAGVRTFAEADAYEVEHRRRRTLCCSRRPHDTHMHRCGHPNGLRGRDLSLKSATFARLATAMVRVRVCTQQRWVDLFPGPNSNSGAYCNAERPVACGRVGGAGRGGQGGRRPRHPLPQPRGPRRRVRHLAGALQELRLPLCACGVPTQRKFLTLATAAQSWRRPCADIRTTPCTSKQLRQSLDYAWHLLA